MADQKSFSDLVEETMNSVAQNTIGDKAPAEGDEGIRPISSPIDYIAGGVGSKLGSAMAASPLVNNEIGSIGSNIARKVAPAAGEVAPPTLAQALKMRAMNPTGQYGAIKTQQPFNSITKAAQQVNPSTGLNRIVTSSKKLPQFDDGGGVQELNSYGIQTPEQLNPPTQNEAIQPQN